MINLSLFSLIFLQNFLLDTLAQKQSVTVALAYTFSHGAKAQGNLGHVYYGSIVILG